MCKFKAIIIILALSGFGAIAQEILDNASVLKMSQAGLSEQVIIAKVRASACTFDLSVDAIILLKRSGVSDGVLSAMQPKVGNDTGNISSEWSVGIQSGSSVIPLDDHPMVKTKYVFLGKGLWGWEFPKAPIRVNSGKLTIVTKNIAN